MSMWTSSASNTQGTLNGPSRMQFCRWVNPTVDQFTTDWNNKCQIFCSVGEGQCLSPNSLADVFLILWIPGITRLSTNPVYTERLEETQDSSIMIMLAPACPAVFVFRPDLCISSAPNITLPDLASVISQICIASMTRWIVTWLQHCKQHR